jgi:hypothetical protein
VAEWPDNFPEACPPEEAADATGSFYRLVEANPPVARDFMSHIELQNAGIIPLKRSFADDCKAAGLSIFAERQDAENVRESVGPLRSKLIAYGDITDQGVMRHTPSRHKSHHTWWLPVDTEPHPRFAVVT